MSVFCALNSALRRRRRHVATVAVMLSLAGVVVVAHSAMNHDHMGGLFAACLAVAETAIVAVGAAVVANALLRRPLWLVAPPLVAARPFVVPPVGIRARAGPPSLQVFRL